MRHILHVDVGNIILNPSRMHCDDVLMIEAGCYAGFSLKRFCICRVSGGQTVRLLYRYLTP